MIQMERPLRVGHVTHGWFKKGFDYDLPRDAAHRSEMPEGFSNAVKVGVEQKLLEITD